MMRAVDAIMECLKAEGVDVVFGYPGGANLPTYDAFVDAGIRHILVRHEAGGGHAAERIVDVVSAMKPLTKLSRQIVSPGSIPCSAIMPRMIAPMKML